MGIKRSEIICHGDLHLEGLNSLFGPNGDKYIIKTLQDTASYARDNGVKTILLLGDTFDGPNPQQSTIVMLLQFILVNSDLEWYTIIGNHDKKDNVNHSSILMQFIAGANLIPNLHVYTEPQYVEINGAPIYFLPWPHYKQPKRRPHPCINIAHLRLSGAMTDSGRVMKDGEADIEEGDDYWVVGDLHTRQKLGKKILYPGNSYQKNFGERLPKGITHSEITWGRKLVVKHRYIPMEPPFRLINLEINSLKDFDQIAPASVERNYFYKLFIHESLVLPANFLTTNANVLKVHGYKTADDLTALKTDTIDLESLPQMDANKVATAQLSTFLKSKSFGPSHIKRARSIVRKIIEEQTYG